MSEHPAGTRCSGSHRCTGSRHSEPEHGKRGRHFRDRFPPTGAGIYDPCEHRIIIVALIASAAKKPDQGAPIGQRIERRRDLGGAPSAHPAG